MEMRLGCAGRGLSPDDRGSGLSSVDFRQLAHTYRRMGLSAAVCPTVEPEQREGLVQAFADEDVVLAEVPAYGLNIVDLDKERRQGNIEAIKSRLHYADEIGALCCVMHGGWVGTRGFGSGGAGNFSKDVFEGIVSGVQEILDDVKPKHTNLVIETESDVLPDGPEEYLELVKAINRSSFRVHFDPVNIITSPRRYHFQSQFLKKCFSLLGPYIVSCHAKDVLYANDERYYPVVRIDEVVPPGRGNLDYRTYLSELSKLEPSPPLIMEHLPGREECLEGRDYLFKIVDEIGLHFVHSHGART